ncbi:hypothetical protein RM780_07755 [Streptomyces sp. DSM 44917]|uniref:Uncharacterized protein n=1 Tax=Streptomyces boetiae TaxID=3075541 RepID=A0ABU2L5L6_9ACTN|nr:hypothetical protein [Streptomyces sp. DSM 44917]MDT0306857.1 hypothetical protein [Streptomyces sp. DSM 44917]
MPTDHKLTFEREVLDLPPKDGWARYAPGSHARTSCTCGLDTGWVPRPEATQARTTHAQEVCPHPETTDTSAFADGPDALHYCTACGAHLQRTEDGHLVPATQGRYRSAPTLGASNAETRAPST